MPLKLSQRLHLLSSLTFMLAALLFAVTVAGIGMLSVTSDSPLPMLFALVALGGGCLGAGMLSDYFSRCAHEAAEYEMYLARVLKECKISDPEGEELQNA